MSPFFHSSLPVIFEESPFPISRMRVSVSMWSVAKNANKPPNFAKLPTNLHTCILIIQPKKKPKILLDVHTKKKTIRTKQVMFIPIHTPKNWTLFHCFLTSHQHPIHSLCSEPAWSPHSWCLQLEKCKNRMRRASGILDIWGGFLKYGFSKPLVFPLITTNFGWFDTPIKGNLHISIFVGQSPSCMGRNVWMKHGRNSPTLKFDVHKVPPWENPFQTSHHGTDNPTPRQRHELGFGTLLFSKQNAVFRVKLIGGG